MGHSDIGRVVKVIFAQRLILQQQQLTAQIETETIFLPSGFSPFESKLVNVSLLVKKQRRRSIARQYDVA